MINQQPLNMDIKIEKPHEIQTSHVEVTCQSVTFLLNLGGLKPIFLGHLNSTHAQ